VGGSVGSLPPKLQAQRDKTIIRVSSIAVSFFISFSSIKIKSATTEAVAQKTQTPIVAKPIQYKGHSYSRAQSY